MKFNANSNPFRLILYVLFFIYLIILTKLILFKTPLGYLPKKQYWYDWSTDLFRADFKLANFTPFAIIRSYYHSEHGLLFSVDNFFGNIIGFIPLGFLLALLFPKWRNAGRIILMSALISLCYESIQLFAVLGIFDVDDIILNTAGGAIGYFIFVLGRKMFKRPRDNKNRVLAS